MIFRIGNDLKKLCLYSQKTDMFAIISVIPRIQILFNLCQTVYEYVCCACSAVRDEITFWLFKPNKCSEIVHHRICWVLSLFLILRVWSESGQLMYQSWTEDITQSNLNYQFPLRIVTSCYRSGIFEIKSAASRCFLLRI